MYKHLVLMTLVLAGAVQAQTKNKQMEQKITHIDIAAAINRAVQDGDTGAAAKWVTEQYKQHTPPVADGRAGLVALVTRIRNKEMPGPVINNVRAFTDGDHVVLHHEVHWPTKKAMFEIFRMENGLAAEHWSGIMDHPATTANGHTMTDGEAALTDRHLTRANKELARDFVETILIKGTFNRIRDFYDENIIQHNPLIDNTVPGLLKGLDELARQGVTIQIEKIEKVLGEGNFVLVCSTGKLGGKPTAFFDLFRLNELNPNLQSMSRLKHFRRPFRLPLALIICLYMEGTDLYCQEPANTIRDRKGNTYAIKKMPDNRLWTTDNLQIDIPGAYCYENAPENCRQYGRLYSWKAAQAVCPLLGEGWRLPSIDEWRQMMKWYGGVRGDSKDSGKTAFRALITGGAAGFNIVFGGCRGAFDSSYTRQGAHGFYWTATEADAGNAWMLNLGKNGQIANQHPNGEKPMAISVRCVKDITVKTQ